MEGFHSKVNKEICKHQSIYALIKFLRSLHTSTLIDIARIKQKQIIRVQSKKDKEKYERIEKIKESFKKNPTDMPSYFESISLQVQYPYDFDYDEASSSDDDHDDDNDLPSLQMEQFTDLSNSAVESNQSRTTFEKQTEEVSAVSGSTAQINRQLQEMLQSS